VGLDITYPHVGDLYIKLVAPSGHEFVLQNRAGGTSANLNKTFTVNLSSEPMEGIWSVVVLDQVQGGVGQVNQVTLKLHD
jgi:subtilisin-like proprotein convertase family protein